MRTVLHMVTKNDAYGHLDCTLTHNLQFFDEAFVVDDDSTDDTMELLRSHGVRCIQKPGFILGMEQSPTLLRFYSWLAMVDVLDLRSDDWIVSLDPGDLVMGDLGQAVRILHAGGFSGAEVPLKFLWNTDPPMSRVDGLWDSISPVRIGCPVLDDHTFAPHQRLPRAAYGGDCYVGELPIHILNLDYLSDVDRLNSYDRLCREMDEPNTFVKSILEPADCSLLDDVPPVWEGIQ